jgi:predicted MFS family arabinose efflux permease
MSSASETSIHSNPAHEIKRARFAVSAVFFLLGSQMAVWAVSVPLIRLKLGYDEAELSRLLLAFGFGSILAVPTASYILKRLPHGQVTRMFGFIGLPMLAIVAIMPNVWLMALFIAMTGMLLAVTDIAMNANAVDVEEESGKAIMSSFHGWFSLGGFTGVLLGPLAAWLGLEWMAILGSAVLWLGFFVVQKGLLDRPVKIPEAAARVPGGWWRNVRWVILILALANLTAYSLEGTVVDWSGVYADRILNAEPVWFGAGFAAFSVTMAIMRFSGDALRSRFGNRVIVVASCLVASLSYGIVASADTLGVAMVGYALLGLGLANLVPILFVMAARVPGVTAGSGIALVAGMGYVGFLTFPPLVGFLARAYGLPNVFGGLAVVALITTLVVFAFPKKKA